MVPKKKRKKRNAELNLFKGCFLTNHFSVLFAGKANMVNTTLKRNLTIYSSQLKDLSNYQAFKHNFSSEGNTKSASVPKECRTIAPGRVLTACAVIQWITVIECVPKACTHCVLIRRLRGNLWLRKWYLPVDCLWIIMHFWITVKNQFLFFSRDLLRDLTITQSNSTSQGLNMMVTWRKQKMCVTGEKKIHTNKQQLKTPSIFLQLNKPM